MFKLTHPKTKEKVSIKEFIAQVKEGQKNMTPYQQTIAIQFGQVTSAIGVIWGIIFSIILGYYWMGLVLIGGMIVLYVQFIGNLQKKRMLKQIEEATAGAEAMLLNLQEVNNGITRMD